MKIGIYSPYLDTCGGGEKYIGKIAEVLAEENQVEFLVEREPKIEELKNRLDLSLVKIGFRIVHVSSPLLSKRNYFLSRATRDYDFFVNQEHFSSLPSKARMSISIQEVPPTRLDFPKYNVIQRTFFDPQLKTYDKIVTNSNFTRKWVEGWYNRSIEVLYPPVDTSQFVSLSKRNLILSVGRFFVEGHCKKQLEMVKAFKELSQDGTRSWEFHLVGSVNDSIRDRAYLEKCRQEARGHSIFFHVNIPFNKLTELCGRSKIFWCATGLGENSRPYEMEHFGISTIEAMSAGCVPVVIGKGGQPEIVCSDIDGFCWNSIEELKSLTVRLENDDALLRKMSRSSIERSKHFGMDVFERKVREIFSNV